MTFDAFLDHFAPVRRVGARYTAECPAHEDRSRDTLHLSLGADGRRLIVCRAVCRTLDILTRKGLRFSDCFEPTTTAPAQRARPLTDTTPWPRLLQLALRDTYQDFRRRQRERAPIYARAAEIRAYTRLIDAARALATDTDSGWTLLALAADLERDQFQLESA